MKKVDKIGQSIYKHKRGTYVARVIIEGKFIHVGTFRTKDEAKNAVAEYKRVILEENMSWDEPVSKHPDLLNNEFIPPPKTGPDWGRLAKNPDKWEERAKESLRKIQEAYVDPPSF